jgi:hypothetical protein
VDTGKRMRPKIILFLFAPFGESTFRREIKD